MQPFRGRFRDTEVHRIKLGRRQRAAVLPNSDHYYSRGPSFEKAQLRRVVN